MTTSSVSVKVVTWEGCPSVEKAAALKDELTAAFAEAAQVVVSVSMLESVDLSIIQLLKAAAAEASLRNKAFHLTGTIKSELSRALIVSGFVQHSSENAREIEAELFGSPSESKER
jgi:anti-anti-sigma regulatory factor